MVLSKKYSHRRLVKYIQKLDKSIYDVKNKSEISFKTCCTIIFFSVCSFTNKFYLNCNNSHAFRVNVLPYDICLGALFDAAEP